MDISTLTRMVAEDAAVRRRQTLQPVGGKGDKIFPPTYERPPRHVYERRRLNGQDIWCVLVDSVQSQANRLEECLLEAIRDGLPIPHVEVDFSESKLDGIGKITSLDAPHRIYDAILRDSELEAEKKPFMKSSLGERLAKATAADASALLEISPTALLFGAWHSTGEGGGLGAKFARSLVSEIVAVGVPVEEWTNRRTGELETRTFGRRTGSRIDPLGILRKVEVYKGDDGGWDVTEAKAGEKAKRVKPSEINHGNILPSVVPLGITCDHLEHIFVLSFAGLRRLRFGANGNDSVGRALLAALGLLAISEQDAGGYALRSRCDLVCDGGAPLELVHPDGSTDTLSLDRAGARSLYEEAFKAVQQAGMAPRSEPIRLKPEEKLITIVQKSQRFALEGRGGEEGETNGALA